ncbi:MAG: outer membrane beta-barrel protein [Azospirillaceae bacterium]
MRGILKRLTTPRVLALCAIAAAMPAAPAAAADRFDGPYVMLQGSRAATATELFGPRGHGPQTNDAEFAGTGLGAGIAIGYGHTIGRFHLGVEAEAEFSNSGWDHGAEVQRNFSLDQPRSVGLSFRAGRIVGDTALLYGTIGVVGARLETDYALPSGRRFDEEETVLGLRVGAGAELEAGHGLFLRMEHSRTAYGETAVQSSGSGNEDTLDTGSARFRIGVGYRLPVAGAPEPLPAPEPDRFEGPYVGAHGLDGLLRARQSGERGDPPGALAVDRGAMGIGLGAFAGYGAAFGRFVVGGEIEAEKSFARFDQHREPSGRTVSAEAVYSVGAAVRGGFVVNDRAMIYGRVGLVRTGFDTDYFVANTGRSFDSEHTATGLRVGGGTEVALAERTFLRLDYTYTDYDAYAVEYVDRFGRTAVDRFDPDESVFRLGIGYRF